MPEPIDPAALQLRLAHAVALIAFKDKRLRWIVHGVRDTANRSDIESIAKIAEEALAVSPTAAQQEQASDEAGG